MTPISDKQLDRLFFWYAHTDSGITSRLSPATAREIYESTLGPYSLNGEAITSLSARSRASLDGDHIMIPLPSHTK